MTRIKFLLGLVCILPVACAGCSSDASARTVVVIEATYPGANAQTVADAVTVPIENQVIGVENARFLHSRCSSDGRCVITVAFADGTDAAMAQVLVQNRVALAMPTVPAAAQERGLTVIKRPEGVTCIVGISSPERRFDVPYLSRYAALQIKDELARIAGVGSVTLVPELDESVFLWLDPDRLARHRMTAADVAQALAAQNLDTRRLPAGRDKDVPIKVIFRGRSLTADELLEVIVKTAGAQVIRLKDLGRAERMATSPDQAACLNGKEMAVLVVAPLGTARPRDVQTAVSQRLAELRKALPDGLRLEAAFDFTPNIESPGQRANPEYLLLDVDLPGSSAAERSRETLGTIEKLLGSLEGVKDVLTLTDNPFDDARRQPCVLLRLVPAGERKSSREELAQAVRTRLEGKVPGATIRVRFPLGTGARAGWSYPIQLAVSGPEAASVRKLAVNLAERLRSNAKLTDVWLDPATEPQPQLDLQIQRDQAAKHGVAISTLNDLLRFQLTDVTPAKQLENLKQLKVRNAEGEMVPLSELVTARVLEAPAVIDRLDGKPMAAITANPSPTASLADARGLCEQLTRDVREELQLPPAYRLTWLRDLPSR
jgi:multidrug efflux pump subunit AcrB